MISMACVLIINILMIILAYLMISSRAYFLMISTAYVLIINIIMVSLAYLIMISKQPGLLPHGQLGLFLD
jgi:hypothetical protein